MRDGLEAGDIVEMLAIEDRGILVEKTWTQATYAGDMDYQFGYYLGKSRREEDQIAIGYLLSKGEEQLNSLKSGSLNMHVSDTPKRKPSKDSWLGQGTPDDKHGRVGVGWPFNRNSRD